MTLPTGALGLAMEKADVSIVVTVSLLRQEDAGRLDELRRVIEGLRGKKAFAAYNITDVQEAPVNGASADTPPAKNSCSKLVLGIVDGVAGLAMVVGVYGIFVWRKKSAMRVHVTSDEEFRSIQALSDGLLMTSPSENGQFSVRSDRVRRKNSFS